MLSNGERELIYAFAQTMATNNAGTQGRDPDGMEGSKISVAATRYGQEVV
jgi:hypothetical protein